MVKNKTQLPPFVAQKVEMDIFAQVFRRGGRAIYSKYWLKNVNSNKKNRIKLFPYIFFHLIYINMSQHNLRVQDFCLISLVLVCVFYKQNHSKLVEKVFVSQKTSSAGDELFTYFCHKNRNNIQSITNRLLKQKDLVVEINHPKSPISLFAIHRPCFQLFRLQNSLLSKMF